MRGASKTKYFVPEGFFQIQQSLSSILNCSNMEGLTWRTRFATIWDQRLLFVQVVFDHSLEWKWIRFKNLSFSRNLSIFYPMTSANKKTKCKTKENYFSTWKVNHLWFFLNSEFLISWIILVKMNSFVEEYKLNWVITKMNRWKTVPLLGTKLGLA